MKKLLVALLFVSSVSFAQNHEPPASVRHSFERDHSSPQNTQWSRTNNSWHANYRDKNNHDVHAYYDTRGNRIATHREIERTEVPRSVDLRVRNRYHGGDNYHVTRIERPNAQPLFQVSLSLGGGNRTVYLDAQGREKQYHAPR